MRDDVGRELQARTGTQIWIDTIVGQPLQTGPQLKTRTFYTQSSHFVLEKYLVN